MSSYALCRVFRRRLPTSFAHGRWGGVFLVGESGFGGSALPCAMLSMVRCFGGCGGLPAGAWGRFMGGAGGLCGPLDGPPGAVGDEVDAGPVGGSGGRGLQREEPVCMTGTERLGGLAVCCAATSSNQGNLHCNIQRLRCKVQPETNFGS